MRYNSFHHDLRGEPEIESPDYFTKDISGCGKYIPIPGTNGAGSIPCGEILENLQGNTQVLCEDCKEL